MRTGCSRSKISTGVLDRFCDGLVIASMPSFVAGLKQGWSFAWRSLMAGELLVTFGVFSVGFLLTQYRQVNDYPAMIAMMIVVLVIGIVIDAVLFAGLDRWVRRRHGLGARCAPDGGLASAVGCRTRQGR